VYSKKDPSATQGAKRSAWNQLVKEFLKVEMSDKLELPNLFMHMPNPYAEAKLQVFKGEI
jgi:hypothetical protein